LRSAGRRPSFVSTPPLAERTSPALPMRRAFAHVDCTQPVAPQRGLEQHAKSFDADDAGGGDESRSEFGIGHESDGGRWGRAAGRSCVAAYGGVKTRLCVRLIPRPCSLPGERGFSLGSTQVLWLASTWWCDFGLR